MTRAADTPTRAVGIVYSLGEPAPVVIVKAAGRDVEPVLAAAEQAGTVVVRDARLVEQLYRVPMDSPIGRELFPVMAVLLAHILKIGRKQEGESS